MSATADARARLTRWADGVEPALAGESAAWAGFIQDLRTLLATTEPEWEYTSSEILDDGTVAFGNAVPTIEDAIRVRDSARSSYPWPEELGIGRRRKAGPWEEVTE